MINQHLKKHITSHCIAKIDCTEFYPSEEDDFTVVRFNIVFGNFIAFKDKA